MKPIEQAARPKRRKRELSEAEIFEIRQLIASGVKNARDYPEVMELNDSDEDEAAAAMVHKPADEGLEDFEASLCCSGTTIVLWVSLCARWPLMLRDSGRVLPSCLGTPRARCPGGVGDHLTLFCRCSVAVLSVPRWCGMYR